MILPEPLLSYDDIRVATEIFRNPSSLISNPWSKDATKLAVLRAMAPCLARFDQGSFFDANVVDALAQKKVGILHSYLLEVEEVHF